MGRQFKPGQLQTGSLYNISSSYALTASYATNAGGSSINTGSFVTTSSFNAFTASYGTGSFTGSFSGNGSRLTGIISASYSTTSSYATLSLTASYSQTASYLTGYTLRSSNNTDSLNWDTRILSDGTVNSINWGTRLLKNNTSTTVLDWQNATFTGSVQGTASYALTASYLSGYISPFPFTGSAIISGSLIVTGSLNVSGISSLPKIRDYYASTGSTGQILATDGTNTKWTTFKDSLQLQINSEGPTVTSGSKAYRYVDDEHYITQITIKSTYTGSIQFILRDSTSIYGSSSLSNGVLYTDTTLTGWTRTIPSGSLLEFVVGSAGGISSGSASTFLFLVNTLRKLT
jgi:hypothetical protein